MDLKNRIFLKLFSGRYQLLLMFGATLCTMAIVSLIAAILVKDKDVLTFLTRILDTLIGFIGGAYSTMWNNYAHKGDRQKEGEDDEKIQPIIPNNDSNSK